MTDRIISRIQGRNEISKKHGLIYSFRSVLIDSVRNTVIRDCLNVEAVLLKIEKSQLSTFGHVLRESHEMLPKGFFWLSQTVLDPEEGPKKGGATISLSSVTESLCLWVKFVRCGGLHRPDATRKDMNEWTILKQKNILI